MELIDEGETDHKIIVLREDDPNFDVVHNMAGELIHTTDKQHTLTSLFLIPLTYLTSSFPSPSLPSPPLPSLPHSPSLPFPPLTSVFTDLERVKPGITDKLLDWLKNYKTSDGKAQNRLKHDEPTSPADANAIIKEVNTFYKNLIAGTCSEEAKEKAAKYSLPKK